MKEQKQKRDVKFLDLVEAVADLSNIRASKVKKVMRSLEKALMDMARFATPQQDVVVHVLEGMTFHATYEPEHETKNNLHGGGIHTVPARIAVKWKINQGYKTKINSFTNEPAKDVEDEDED